MKSTTTKTTKTSKPTSYVGKQLTIKAGTIVNRAGVRAKRSADTTVTVRDQEIARNGKIRVFWKSNGLMASALI